jgi:hypothetical protein
MKEKKKTPLSILLELFNNSKDFANADSRSYYEQRYKYTIQQAKADESEEEFAERLKIKTGNYSLRRYILSSKWVKSGIPATHARTWLFKEVLTNTAKYKYGRQLLGEGELYTFEYKNPKYKDDLTVLPWFDKYPLMLSLGPKVTKLGIRNIGFNLHLLPPKIRIIVLCCIFEYSKSMYRYMIFMGKTKPVNINYYSIIGGTHRYGTGFCVRMYIPKRITYCVKFPYIDWRKAVFIPSRGYERIQANKLIKEWRAYCKKRKINISSNLDWKSII